ncbi:sensor domain-containing diguanylate cyclase [Calidifontibacillus oryziterrae]|uniref:sensor domain-containing diguanylate cyclase n=1 Tax=Calidifontibacillus oryziterrae TaxID=1191699 RepID=UPI00031C9135|nr:sensor domain-containing diguanylate cyclase [Calidifontibacillus oryziterrae]
MQPSKMKQAFLWLIWIVCWPMALVVLHNMQIEKVHFYVSHYGLDILTFLILMIAVALFPIIINETPLLFIQGISMAVFLRFGLFIEVVLTQIAVLALLIRLGIDRKSIYKIPLNLLLFLISSVLGGYVYTVLGGFNGVVLLTYLPTHFEVAIYAFVIFLCNHIMLYLVRRLFLKKGNVTFFGRGFWWEVLTALLVFPLGLVLYIIYGTIGTIGIFLIGIPFLSVSFILKLYYTSQKMNYHLKQTSELGQQLTARLKKSEVLKLFIDNLYIMLPVDFIYIFGVRGNSLSLLRHIENGQEQPIKDMPINRGEGIFYRAWILGQSELYKTASQWHHLQKKYFTIDVESLLVVPIKRNRLITGVIVLGSRKKNAFDKYQLSIIDILASHLAVAVENSKLYEQKKRESERCPLTKLYNYRYFEKILVETFNQLHQNLNHISLVILDLDHFKSINDTYGHQAGNEILCELAERLKEIIRSKGIVARFGGEEFVLLLPGYNKDEAYNLAEMIRKEISNNPFTIDQSISEGLNKLKISVTASLGVATAPEDCDEPFSLLRNADRAMYTGAKQMGRNKVSVYGALKV